MIAGREGDVKRRDGPPAGPFSLRMPCRGIE